jgi:hypothetical protein
VVAPFDLFKISEEGQLIWFGVADTLEAAKSKVRRAQLNSKSEYVILSQVTGNRLVISPDDPQAPDEVLY